MCFLRWYVEWITWYANNTQTTTSSILIHHDFYSIHLLFNTLYNIYSSKIIVKMLF